MRKLADYRGDEDREHGCTRRDDGASGTPKQIPSRTTGVIHDSSKDGRDRLGAAQSVA